ncbi:hypothetical protein [Brevibacillus reuszeri]|uniref:hypothetical protein n=1 Tax=Brevibacillus reuszeri TaxID=54915 RepID=UPI000CCC4518|nr:hypothetical protein [Brevibacillus reuszeri]
MKVFFDLGKYRKAVLWKNELPLLPRDIDHETKFSLQLNEPVVSENKKLALELKLPRNSSYYALLGVEFVPNQTSELLVNIKLNDSNGPSYNSEIELHEEIFSGIPSDYANSIINSAKEKILESNWQYAGNLTFVIGAHSLIGSSDSIFSKVTKTLIALLSMDLSLTSSLSDNSVICSELDK